jgi:hypothetical protein
LTKTNANTNSLSKIASNRTVQKEKTSSFREATLLGHSMPAQNRGSQFPHSESHVEGSHTHPTACEQRKARLFFLSEEQLQFDKKKYQSKFAETIAFFARISPTNVEARAITESLG